MSKMAFRRWFTSMSDPPGEGGGAGSASLAALLRITGLSRPSGGEETSELMLIVERCLESGSAATERVDGSRESGSDEATESRPFELAPSLFAIRKSW